MSGKKPAAPAPISGTATTEQGSGSAAGAGDGIHVGAAENAQRESAVGEGKLSLTGEMLEKATIEFLECRGRIEKVRYKPEPKASVAETDRVLNMGLSVAAEAEMLKLSEGRIHQLRADKRRRNALPK